MILPIGDTPNPRITPWVTYVLIAVNVVVFLWLLPLTGQRPGPDDPLLEEYLRAMLGDGRVSAGQLGALAGQVSAYDLVLFDHGVRPGALQLGDLLTSMFLHGGWSHLAGNMLFLWIYGDNLEARLGRGGYLAFYLGTGLLAGLGDVALRTGSMVPSVGASGAISGVLGGYFLWFPQNRVRLFVLFFPFFMRTIEVGARWVLGAYVVFNNLMPLLLSGNTGVSYGAHLGGFFAGLGAAWVLRSAQPADPRRADRQRGEPRPSGGWGSGPRGPERRGEPRARDQRTAEVVPPPEDTSRAIDARLAAGDVDGASRLYFAARTPVHPGVQLRLGRALEAARAGQAAGAVYERLLREQARAPQANAARLGMARVLLGYGHRGEAWALLEQVLSRPHAVEEGEEARELMALIAP